MKKVMKFLAVVLLSTTEALPAEVPLDLEPSLRILDPVSAPMPDPRGVPFYVAFPDSQGTLRDGTGYSDHVRGWFRQMEPMLAQFVKSSGQLRQHVDVYGDTVREEGNNVLETTAGIKGQLEALNRETGGKLRDLLGRYNSEVSATRLARSGFDAATKTAEHARYLVEANDAAARECNSLLELSHLEAARQPLLAKMQRGNRFLNAVEKALLAMATGPQSAVSYALEEATTTTLNAAKQLLRDVFYTGARETLADIELKIHAIEESLQALACREQSASLNAMKANLEARMIDVLVAFGTVIDHRVKAWVAIDDLAALRGSTGREVSFFKALQAYNSQVNHLGRTVFDALNSYLELLGREPLARGPRVLKQIEGDVRRVQSERQQRDPSGTWLAKASETEAYLNTYARWYENDVRRGQAVIADLREGKHLDFVDRMIARATRELGGTVAYDDMIH